jgi:hypothetical protein
MRLSIYFIFSSFFFITNVTAQNVGIGSTSPQSKLHVVGDIKADSISVGTAGISSLDQNQEISGTPFLISGSGWQSFTAGNTSLLDYVSLYYGNTGVTSTTLAIYEGEGTAGSVLISTTLVILANSWCNSSSLNIPVTAGQKYTIRVLSASYWEFIQSDNYTGGRMDIDPSWDHKFRTYNQSAGSSLVISSAGFLGVNKTNPTERIDVNGKIKTTSLQLTNGAANGYMLSSDASGNAVWAAPATPTNYWTLSGANIYNNNAGNTGIGTNNPTAKLHVSGNQKIDAANSIEFGAGVSKENNAGKIGYETFTAGTLDITGAGTTIANRKIKLWAEAGAEFVGKVTTTALTVNGATQTNSLQIGSGTIITKILAGTIDIGASNSGTNPTPPNSDYNYIKKTILFGTTITNSKIMVTVRNEGIFTDMFAVVTTNRTSTSIDIIIYRMGVVTNTGWGQNVKIDWWIVE